MKNVKCIIKQKKKKIKLKENMKICLMFYSLSDFRRVHGQLTSFLSKYALQTTEKSNAFNQLINKWFVNFRWKKLKTLKTASHLQFSKSPTYKNICRFEVEDLILSHHLRYFSGACIGH